MEWIKNTLGIFKFSSEILQKGQRIRGGQGTQNISQLSKNCSNFNIILERKITAQGFKVFFF